MAARLPPSDVSVWLCDTRSLVPEGDVHVACVALLDADERARHGRLRQPSDRLHFAAAHALLRTALSSHAAALLSHGAMRQHPTSPAGDRDVAGQPPMTPTDPSDVPARLRPPAALGHRDVAGQPPTTFTDFSDVPVRLRPPAAQGAGPAPPASAWRFARAPGGRPHVVSPVGAPSLHFSLTHCTGLVACAIAAQPRVGLDAEPAGRALNDVDALARLFAPSEQAALEACVDAASRAQLWLRLWTLKEAFAKALGRGLALPLTATAFAWEPPLPAAAHEGAGEPSGPTLTATRESTGEPSGPTPTAALKGAGEPSGATLTAALEGAGEPSGRWCFREWLLATGHRLALADGSGHGVTARLRWVSRPDAASA